MSIQSYSSQSNQADSGQPEFIFSPFEEFHLNLNYRPNLVDADDITARFLFCLEPRGGAKDPLCVLNASLKKSEVINY